MKRFRLFVLGGSILAGMWLLSSAGLWADDKSDRKDDAQKQRQEQQDDQQRGNQKQNAQSDQDDDETEYRGMEHAALGVLLSERAGQGVRIRDTLTGSPAEKAGLRSGDKIVKIDDKKMSSYSDVIRFMNRVQPGQSAKIIVQRNGEEKTLPVTFASREQLYGEDDEQFSQGAQRQSERFGDQNQRGQNNRREQGEYSDYGQRRGPFQRQTGDQSQDARQYSNQRGQGGPSDWADSDQRGNMRQQQGRSGNRGRQQTYSDHGVLGIDLENQRGAAVVRDLWPGSPAEQAGLRRGDEIVAIDNQQIRSFRDLAGAIQNREPGERVQLTIDRNGQERNLRVRLASSQELERNARGSRDNDQNQEGNRRRNDNNNNNDDDR
jgi:C-terminal processing protease CtpA/Prc